MAQQVETLFRDARHAARSLRRTPAFTAIAILCFAIGIGVNAMMFGLVNALLFRPPPHVRDAAEVFRLHLTYTVPGGPDLPHLGGGNLAYSDYTDLRDGTRTLEVGAYATHDLTLGHGAEARAVPGMFVTPSFLHLLGVRPFLGRFLVEDDDGADGAAVAILSYGLWQRRFGADSGVLGRTLRVGRGTYTIIGVAPEGFRGTDLEPVELWLPSWAALHELYDGDIKQFRASQGLHAIVRLRPGVSTMEAEADASRAFQLAYASRFGQGFKAVMVATMDPIIAGYGGDLTKDDTVSLWLAGVSVIVLLVAVANIANLLLARATARRRDVAIRLALGITRGRLGRQLFSESLMLAIAGGAVGLIIAGWGNEAIKRFLFPSLRVAGGMVDTRVLGVAAFTAVLTAVLCSLTPMRQAIRSNVLSHLKAGPHDGSDGRSRLRIALLVGQVALTMVLLVGAGLFARSWSALRSIDLGIDVEHLVVGRMALSEAGYSTAEADAIMHRVRDRVRVLPGVREASLASTAPFLGSFSWPDFTVPGEDIPLTSDGTTPLLHINDVSPEFFSTIHTPLIRGRTFTEADEHGARPVAIINQAMADALWPHENAIGKCIQVGWQRGPARAAPCSEIIGIVRGTHIGALHEPPQWQYFAPLSRGDVNRTPLLLVETAHDPRALVQTIRRAMQDADPDLPYADVQTMEQVVEPQLRPWKLGTTMFTLFGAIALALALCGLYGVFSYMVERRRQELGIRIALGARSVDIAQLIVGEAVRASAIGIALGLLGAIALGRALASLLVGISWLDVGLLAVTSILVTVTTILATYLPARRAIRVDPTALLHME